MQSCVELARRLEPYRYAMRAAVQPLKDLTDPPHRLPRDDIERAIRDAGKRLILGPFHPGYVHWRFGRTSRDEEEGFRRSSITLPQQAREGADGVVFQPRRL